MSCISREKDGQPACHAVPVVHSDADLSGVLPGPLDSSVVANPPRWSRPTALCAPTIGITLARRLILRHRPDLEHALHSGVAGGELLLARF